MNHKRGARARLWSSRGTKKWNLLLKVFLKTSSGPFPSPAGLWGSRGGFYFFQSGRNSEDLTRGGAPESCRMQLTLLPPQTHCPCSGHCFIPWKARGEDESWCCLQKRKAQFWVSKCLVCCLEVQEFYGEGKRCRAGTATSPRASGTFTFPQLIPGINSFRKEQLKTSWGWRTGCR